MTDSKSKHNDSGTPKPVPKSQDGSRTTEIKSSGDNRGLGDADGNRNAGDARSPGADNPEPE